jgi:serine/threonine protein phosphatase PrpC
MCTHSLGLYHNDTDLAESVNKARRWLQLKPAVLISSPHIFHLGDTRIYRLRDNALEQLTKDHRLWVSQDKSYLSRAMGINAHLEIDYEALPVDKGDTFLMTTDGIYEFITTRLMIDAIQKH